MKNRVTYFVVWWLVDDEFFNAKDSIEANDYIHVQHEKFDTFNHAVKKHTEIKNRMINDKHIHFAYMFKRIYKFNDKGFCIEATNMEYMSKNTFLNPPKALLCKLSKTTYNRTKSIAK